METKWTFRVRWANISQQPGQTEQELTTEIRRIHAKAYPDRDAETRRVDLIDKFLDSLCDESQRSAIEFNKCPHTIEEAVKYAIQYRETTRTQHASPAVYDSSDEEDDIKLCATRPVHKEDRKESSKQSIPREENKLVTEIQRLARIIETQQVPNIKQELQSWDNKNPDANLTCFNCSQLGHKIPNCPLPKHKKREKRRCFICGKQGHIKRNCWHCDDPNYKCESDPQATNGNPTKGNPTQGDNRKLTTSGGASGNRNKNTGPTGNRNGSGSQ